MRRPANLVLASTRAAWGVALLTVPGRLIRWAGGDDSQRARAVGRLLGARHLVQAGLVAAGWRPAVWPLGPAADVAHAATAASLAAADRRWRRVGIIDTVLALSFASSPLLVRR
jgi:hypothetical protein